MFTNSRSGAFCAISGSISTGRSRGARATTPSSPPRPPRSSGSIWRRPRTPSSSVSTRSRRSRRWSGRRATSGCPTGGRSPATATTTSGTARRRSSPRSIWPPARSRRPTRSAVGASSSSPSWTRSSALHPGKEIHAVLDNLNTHKKNEEWLAAHPNVHFHFTPTRASWLNQVEIWFSILAGKSLRGASFTSVAQLRQHIDDFITAYNAKANALRLDKARSPPTALQGPPYQSIVIPGTSFSRRRADGLDLSARGHRGRPLGKEEQVEPPAVFGTPD